MATQLDPVRPRAPELAATMAEIGFRAKQAAAVLRTVPAAVKNAALRAGAQSLRDGSADILRANEDDVSAAAANGTSKALLDRLKLTPARIDAMADSLDAVADLDDPVGRVLAAWQRPNGLQIERVGVPLGVIGVIYESRPNVTADAAALCLKAGNAAILRGGSDSFATAGVIVDLLRASFAGAGAPADAIQRVPTVDRDAVGMLLRMDETVDVIVPRGGRSLVERVRNESLVPVFAHLDGICHVYLHQDADPAMATDIALNAKLRRTGICGAAETLLVDRAAAETLLPPVLSALKEAGCELRGDAAVRAIFPAIVEANAADWTTEYLDAILSVAVVDDLDAAVAHINGFGSHHTDAIVTADESAAQRFFDRVDSAIVMHNASTQFADGGEFGMGAEIGISTGRLHARGPVGVDQLTTFAYRVRGNGQTRPA